MGNGVKTCPWQGTLIRGALVTIIPCQLHIFYFIWLFYFMTIQKDCQDPAVGLGARLTSKWILFCFFTVIINSPGYTNWMSWLPCRNVNNWCLQERKRLCLDKNYFLCKNSDSGISKQFRSCLRSECSSKLTSQFNCYTFVHSVPCHCYPNICGIKQPNGESLFRNSSPNALARRLQSLTNNYPEQESIKPKN